MNRKNIIKDESPKEVKTMNNHTRLLTRTLPVGIETAAENEKVIEIIESLTGKGELSSAERKLLKLLTRLVEDFEEKTNPSEAADVLKFIRERRGMKQKDSISVGGAEGILSGILNGKRPSTIKTAKKSADFRGLSSCKI